MAIDVNLSDVYRQQIKAKLAQEDANSNLGWGEGKYIKKVGSIKNSKCKVPADTFGDSYGDVGDQWQCKCGIRWKLEYNNIKKKRWSRFVRDYRKSHGKRMQVIDALVGKG